MIVPSIEGISLRSTPDYLWLQSLRPLRALSSGVVGHGLGVVHHLLSVRVPLSYHSEHPERDVDQKAAMLGIAPPFVGFLTAVDLSTATVTNAQAEGISVLTVASTGVGNASAAGKPARHHQAGTINLMVVIDGAMTDGALVNAVMVATEAKARALSEAGVLTADGDVASGTSSDAIAIASTGRGSDVIRYAGTATAIGLAIGRTVYKAIGTRLKER